MRFKQIYFFDMCQIYKGSLESVAKDLGCNNNVKADIEIAKKDE